MHDGNDTLRIALASVCLLLSVAFADTGVASLAGTLVMLFK